MLLRSLIIACSGYILTACGGGSADNTPPPNPDRPRNTSCIAGHSQSFAALRLQNAFPNLNFSAPVAMIPATSGNTVYVVELGGTVRALVNDASSASSTEFANISSSLDTRGEGGLLGMALDPDFDTNGYVYLSYTAPVPAAQQIPNQRIMWSRVSRFDTNTGHSQILPASERVILQVDQPYTNHNGGQIAFDSNGYLYFGLGDGGSGNDPNHNAQSLTTLLGAMLRIDPHTSDNTGRGLNYAIPSGNPFYGNVNCDNACPEIYAWGLRNPWRWSFDRTTGSLFAGDVGQSAREEIDIVQNGKNYGWGCYEGSIVNSNYSGDCSAFTTNPALHMPPIHDYPRTDGTTVSGGYVYRGNIIPALRGQYVFADYGSGQVWAITDPYGTPQRRTLFSTGRSIVSLAEDAAGELYLIDIGTGNILRIEPDPNSQATPSFASQLSATGCADNTDPKLPASGLIAYEVNAPLWSDNASKKRWLALPDNLSIDIDSEHDWHFPLGSVLRKDFYLNNQIVETRLLAHHSDGVWAGYSYEWNATQSDASLLDSEKTVSVAGQQWTYPSPSQCLQCHTEVAGKVLGAETAQLNHLSDDPRGTGQINQLSYFDEIGLFSTPLGDPSTLPRLRSYDDITATPESLARAYLHSNCSHCHQTNGPVAGNMNLHYAVSFSEMNICGMLPMAGDVLGATHLFTPNNTSDSILYQRMRESALLQRMPPVGTAIDDSQGLQLIANWISSLVLCP